MESPYFQVQGVHWNNGALSQTVGDQLARAPRRLPGYLTRLFRLACRKLEVLGQDLHHVDHVGPRDRIGEWSIGRMIKGNKRTVELGDLDMPRRVVDSLNSFPIEWLLLSPFNHSSPRFPQPLDDLRELINVKGDGLRRSCDRTNLNSHGLTVLSDPHTDPRLGHDTTSLPLADGWSSQVFSTRHGSNRSIPLLRVRRVLQAMDH